MTPTTIVAGVIPYSDRRINNQALASATVTVFVSV